MRARPFVGAAIVVGLGLGGWLLADALIIRSELNAARTALVAAKDDLLNQRLDQAQSRVTGALVQVQKAQRRSSDPAWSAAGYVPVIGRSFAQTGHLADAAEGVLSQVFPPALAAARTLDPETLRRADGSFNLERVRSANPDLHRAAQAAAAVQEDLQATPTGGIGPIGAARADLGRQVEELAGALDGADRAAEMAPLLLGADRPRRFFVLVQQAAESRGTGGLPGGFVILETADGRMRVTQQGSNFELPVGEVRPPSGLAPEFVEHYGNLGAFSELWLNTNVSPDLTSVGKVIAGRWKDKTGQSIDGVVALDAPALANVLRGSGEIALPGGRSLAPDELVDYLAIGQYADYAPPTGTPGIDRSEERKELLRLIAERATARLISGGGDTASLVLGLGAAVQSGHLRMTSSDPALQPKLNAAGVSGALPQGPAPVAYPVVFNSAGGKLDYFLDRSIRYTAGACTGSTRSSEISVKLTNRAPKTGLPPYVMTRILSTGPVLSTTNNVTLMIYGTRGATLRGATLDGKPLVASAEEGPSLESFTEDGLPVWHVLMELPREQSRTMTLSLTEPTAAGPARLPEQPLLRPLQATQSVPVCG